MDALIRNIVQIQSRVRMYLARRNFLYDLHIQRQQLEQLGMLCSLVEQSSEMLYNEMVQHVKYDREKATKKVINSCCLLITALGKATIKVINFCRLLITFANSLDLDQDRQNVRPAFDPDHLTLWLCSCKNVLKVNFEKKSVDDKSMKNYPACFWERSGSVVESLT